MAAASENFQTYFDILDYSILKYNSLYNLYITVCLFCCDARNDSFKKYVPLC